MRAPFFTQSGVAPRIIGWATPAGLVSKISVGLPHKEYLQSLFPAETKNLDSKILAISAYQACLTLKAAGDEAFDASKYDAAAFFKEYSRILPWNWSIGFRIEEIRTHKDYSPAHGLTLVIAESNSFKTSFAQAYSELLFRTQGMSYFSVSLNEPIENNFTLFGKCFPIGDGAVDSVDITRTFLKDKGLEEEATSQEDAAIVRLIDSFCKWARCQMVVTFHRPPTKLISRMVTQPRLTSTMEGTASVFINIVRTEGVPFPRYSKMNFQIRTRKKVWWKAPDSIKKPKIYAEGLAEALVKHVLSEDQQIGTQKTFADMRNYTEPPQDFEDLSEEGQKFVLSNQD